VLLLTQEGSIVRVVNETLFYFILFLYISFFKFYLGLGLNVTVI